MKYMGGLVSIIIPTYNRQDFIGCAIESCLNQTYKDIEIIIIDDGSTDNTKNIIDGYIDKNENKIKYIVKENSGVSSSRNIGIKLSKGEFIQFLDSDDFMEETKVEKHVRLLKDNPSIFGVFSGTIYYKEGISNEVFRNLCKFKGSFYQVLIKGNCIPIHSIITRRTEMYFDENMRCYEDWDYWLRALKNKQISYIDEYLNYVNIHKNNTSKFRKEMTLGEICILKKLESKGEFLGIIKYSLFTKYYAIEKKKSLSYLFQAIKLDKFNIIRVVKFIITRVNNKNNDIYE